MYNKNPPQNQYSQQPLSNSQGLYPPRQPMTNSQGNFNQGPGMANSSNFNQQQQQYGQMKPPYGQQQPPYGQPPQYGQPQAPYGQQQQPPYGQQQQPPYGQQQQPPFGQQIPPMGKTSSPGNVEVVSRGNGINDKEYNDITSSCIEVNDKHIIPMSTMCIKKIKEKLNGEWYVFVCPEKETNFDFYLSFVDGGRFLTFKYGKNEFHVCRIS